MKINDAFAYVELFQFIFLTITSMQEIHSLFVHQEFEMVQKFRRELDTSNLLFEYCVVINFLLLNFKRAGL